MSCILFLDFDDVTHPDPCRKDEYFRPLPLIEGATDESLGEQIRVIVIATGVQAGSRKLIGNAAWTRPMA